MTTGKTHSHPAERILNVADRLFYEQGYTGTGVNQIIAEAAVAKASFYQHFPSKEKLVVAYLKKRHNDWFNRLRERVRAEPDPRQRVFALFGFLEDWLVDVDFRGCAFLNIASESPVLGAEVRALVIRHKAELRAYIHQLVTSLTACPAGDLADAVHLLFEGAIVEAQVTGDLWPVKTARTTVTRLLAR